MCRRGAARTGPRPRPATSRGARRRRAPTNRGPCSSRAPAAVRGRGREPAGRPRTSPAPRPRGRRGTGSASLPSVDGSVALIVAHDRASVSTAPRPGRHRRRWHEPDGARPGPDAEPVDSAVMDRTAKPATAIDDASMATARPTAFGDALESMWAPVVLVIAALAVLVFLGRDMTFYH